jgi:hypothetical protein
MTTWANRPPQQIAPCAGHAHVHAADVRQETDLALGVTARQSDGNDVALLARNESTVPTLSLRYGAITPMLRGVCWRFP